MREISIKFKVDSRELDRANNLYKNLKNLNIRINLNSSNTISQLTSINRLINNINNTPINIRVNNTELNNLNNQLNNIRNSDININTRGNNNLRNNTNINSGGGNLSRLTFGFVGLNSIIRNLGSVLPSVSGAFNNFIQSISRVQNPSRYMSRAFKDIFSTIEEHARLGSNKLMNDLSTVFSFYRNIFKAEGLSNNLKIFGQNLKNIFGNLFRDISGGQDEVNNSSRRAGGGLNFLTGMLKGLGKVLSIAYIVGTLTNAFKNLAVAIKTTLINAVQTAFDYLSNKQMTTASLAILNNEGPSLLKNGKLNLAGAKDTTKFVGQVEEYARQSPLPTQHIMSGIKMGTSMNMTQEDSFNMARRVGEVVGTGDELYSVMRQLTQGRGIGKVLSKDIYAMNDASFPIVDMVKQSTGMTDAEFWEKVTDGAMDYNTVIEAINKQTSEGGKYFGAMNIKAQTYYGQMEVLADTVKIKLSQMFEGVFDKVTNVLPKIVTMVENIFDKLSSIDLSSAFDTLGDSVYNAANMLLQASGITELLKMNGDDLNDSFQYLAQVTAVVINITAVLGSVFIALGRTILNVITIVAKLVWAIAAGIGSAVAVVGQAVVDLGQFIIQWFENVKWINIGKNIVKGIANGLMATANLIVKAVDAVIKPIVDGANSAVNSINSVFGTNMGTVKYKSAKGLSKGDYYSYDPIYSGNASVVFQSTQFLIDQVNSLSDTIQDSIWQDMKDIGAAWSFTYNPTDILKALAKPKKTKNKLEAPGKILPSDSSAGNKESGKDGSDKDKASGIKDKDGSDKDKASGIKDITDAVKELSDTLQSAIDKLFKFGDAFQRLKLERFSPGKLIRRTTKYFTKFKEWGDNLSKLSALGIPENVLYELRQMGLDSYGIVKGLLRSTSEQRSLVIGNLAGIGNVATVQAGFIVKHEHSGTIDVKDVNGNIKSLDVANTITSQVMSNLNKYLR